MKSDKDELLKDSNKCGPCMQNNNQYPSENRLSERNEKPKMIPRFWGLMTFYERFEHLVVIILSLIISIVVIFALLQLVKETYHLLIQEALNPLDFKIFQSIFGMIMTLLIAMEFKHSIIKTLERHSHIVHTKTIILIALPRGQFRYRHAAGRQAS